jgi:hypothetical protein
MDYCFDILTIIGARMVEDCVIFTKVRGSGLDSIRYGNILCYAWEMS